MSSVDLGANNVNKEAWQARATILGRIASYYKTKLGQVNKAGDEEISYADYWDDLMSLKEDNIAERDNIITELRLYNEIVAQINNSYIQFKDAGITQKQMEDALTDIEKRMELMNTSSNTQAENLETSIRMAAALARNNIKAIFPSGSQGGN